MEGVRSCIEIFLKGRYNIINILFIYVFLSKRNDSTLSVLWQAILLFIMQNRYLICYIRYLR